ncbi:MAG: hypothetical protein ABI239_00870 [Aquihabitans sp.]
MSRRLFAPFAVGLLSVMSIAGVACSSDAQDKTKDAAESVGDDIKDGADDVGDTVGTKTDEAAARAAAEELRSRMKANDTANDEGIRSIAALTESAADLTGDPEVTGIEDGDGDGLDDDGKVQVNVGDSSACLTLPEEGEDTEVEGGAC